MLHLFFEGKCVIYFELYINNIQCLKLQITENIFGEVYGNEIPVYSKVFKIFFNFPNSGQRVKFLKREEGMGRNFILVHVSFMDIFLP